MADVMMADEGDLPQEGSADKPALPFKGHFCPEKIIFCVDLNNEMNNMDFQRGNNRGIKILSRMELVKNALRIFLFSKHRMSAKHEYAICLLTETVNWFQDFTNDLDVLNKIIQNLQPQQNYTKLNMATLFETLDSKIKIPDASKPPEVVYRVIFLYSRSTIIPDFGPNDQTKQLVAKMIHAPSFFFDCLYLHEKPTPQNRPQEVYDFLTDLEGKYQNSYFFENSSNVRRFHYHMALLLAHPLQRPDQNQMNTHFPQQE